MDNEKTTKDEKEMAGSCPAAMTGYAFRYLIDQLQCRYYDYREKQIIADIRDHLSFFWI